MYLFVNKKRNSKFIYSEVLNHDESKFFSWKEKMVVSVLKQKFILNRAFSMNPKPSTSAKNFKKNPTFKGNVPKNLFSKDCGSFFEKLFKRYDGIQKQFKTLKNLDIQQAIIATSNPFVLTTGRGCWHCCPHCYAEAKFPIKETSTHISSVLFDDFCNMSSNIADMHEIIKQDFSTNMEELSYIMPFWDGDPLATKMTDSNGFLHGIVDAVDILYKKFKKPISITTAGTIPSDEYGRQQAKELARYFKENPKALDGDKVFVSLNPFYSLIEKVIP